MPVLSANIHPATLDTDERNRRLKLLANVFIELYLSNRNNKIAESPAKLAEAA